MLRRQPRFGVMLLLYQLLSVIGVSHIPPSTLLLVVLQASVFLRLFSVPWHSVADVCLSLNNIWYSKEYTRLIFAAIEHVDDWHMYYNMISFIYKGRTLEKKFGSIYFLFLVISFMLLTNILYVALCLFATEYIDADYGNHCAVGFSGVIFGMKVLINYYFPNHNTQVMGIPILFPASYAVWVELILIQIFLPNVSFIGHLAGILVGIAYVKGPLKVMIDTLYSLVMNILHPRPLNITHNAGTSSYRTTYLNSHFAEYIPIGMSEEEQMYHATEASLHVNYQNK